jgi:glutamate racemase
MRQLPDQDMVYFGDTARTPYGTKSRNTVIGYAVENTEFLLEKGADIIIMACNSASSVATETLREKFDVPVFEVISPAVGMALNISVSYRIGVIGTRATINSGIYEKKITREKPEAKVFSVPCPLLVPLVEEGWFGKPETRMIVKKYLHPLKVKQIDTLILGCTHYPILMKLITSKVGKKVNIIDSSIAVTEMVSDYLEKTPDVKKTLKRNGRAEFFVSDYTAQFEKTAKTLLGGHIRLKQAGG